MTDEIIKELIERIHLENVYTHSFDPAKIGKLVNSAPELFAHTKAELLAFAAFLEQ